MKFMGKEAKKTWNLSLDLRKREKLEKMAKCQKYGVRRMKVLWATKEG